MKVTALDFETYYDNQYSLRKMTPVEYILDPRFEMIGLAVREADTRPYWVHGPDVGRWFKECNPQGLYFSHNWLFDGCIASWRYGFVPKIMSCTLSIARATLQHEIKSLALDNVSAHLGIGVKGKTVHKVAGMGRQAIIDAGLYGEYAQYSMDDADLAMGIFTKLVRSGRFPVKELEVLDLVLRAAVKPRFQLDLNVLAEHRQNIINKKNALLATAMLAGADGKPSLMSNDQFAALLREQGVDPPTKVSPVTQKVSWAFAKTDEDFLELQEHENPAVQALVAARLGVKSTLEETRTDRLISISRLDWPEQGQVALMPIPLRYSGAHTHRLSGDWRINMQNLPSRGGNNTIRRALVAIPGEEVTAGDESQIEARITAWICGQWDLVEAFASGADIYSEFATELFGHLVNRKLKDDPQMVAEGFVGKTCILGLGFGVGWEKLLRTVRLGGVNLEESKAFEAVNLYRRKYSNIERMWKSLNYKGIPALIHGDHYTIGPCSFEKEAVNLPSGLQLKYNRLGWRNGEYVYHYGGRTKRLYGASLLENIVQALARIITMDAAVRAQKRLDKMDIWLNLQAHDELAYVHPIEDGDAVRAILAEELARRPPWGPELPLACEVNSGPSYGDCK